MAQPTRTMIRWADWHLAVPITLIVSFLARLSVGGGRISSDACHRGSSSTVERATRDGTVCPFGKRFIASASTRTAFIAFMIRQGGRGRGSNCLFVLIVQARAKQDTRDKNDTKDYFYRRSKPPAADANREACFIRTRGPGIEGLIALWTTEVGVCISRGV